MVTEKGGERNAFSAFFAITQAFPCVAMCDTDMVATDKSLTN